jgi:hypothetical protein
MIKTIEERFYESFQQSLGCWEWEKRKDDDGYGLITINSKPYRAHRLSWEIYHGNIPAGMCVLHHCDNSSCVNPYHLFLGTHQDNMRDMIRKGRCKLNHGNTMVGSENPNAKLTEIEVTEIKKLLTGGKRVKDLAIQFNNSYQVISNVKNNRRWKCVS